MNTQLQLYYYIATVKHVICTLYTVQRLVYILYTHVYTLKVCIFNITFTYIGEYTHTLLPYHTHTYIPILYLFTYSYIYS